MELRAAKSPSTDPLMLETACFPVLDGDFTDRWAAASTASSAAVLRGQ
jgi:hypothetical protein